MTSGTASDDEYPYEPLSPSEVPYTQRLAHEEDAEREETVEELLARWTTLDAAPPAAPAVVHVTPGTDDTTTIS
jgi:hypothetical protein